ncbi:MAG TPA: hypothetical protein VN946_02190 [Terriglobales bacterium]|nr:hypothetical protein [Terriglobales bacterium]
MTLAGGEIGIRARFAASIRFPLGSGTSMRATADKGTHRIALMGDSAGGNLALVFLSIASA